MVGVGEETGALDTMLAKIADFYDSEVEAAVKALTSIMEPVMIIFVGGIVGVIVISMYLPLFTSITRLIVARSSGSAAPCAAELSAARRVVWARGPLIGRGGLLGASAGRAGTSVSVSSPTMSATPDESRSGCTPCRGTGKLVSGLGGSRMRSRARGAGGAGEFQPGRDAQQEGPEDAGPVPAG